MSTDYIDTTSTSGGAAFGPPSPDIPDYVNPPAADPGSSTDQWSANYVPVVPDASGLPISGQLSGLPGGGASDGAVHTSDGINAVYRDPAVNPTPTGGYMTALAQIATAAASGMTSYVKGSPSVAIPRPLVPGSIAGSGMLSLTTPQGTTNWTTIAIIAAFGIVGAILVVRYA
jgi:hypothetical protein